jgi:hypothetical protein
LIYKNLYLHGKGGFGQGEYWSSTPGYGPHVWRAHSFDSTGRSLLWVDGMANNVRAVRKFDVSKGKGTPTGPKTRPKADEKPYLDALNARRSQVTAEQRQKLIHDNVPVWILAKDEDYFPMPFQAFKANDISTATQKSDGTIALTPKTGTDRYSKTGRANQYRPDANRITDPQHFMLGGHRMIGLAPRANPTYAFYCEKPNGDIWIRYFMFFGYNRAPIGGAIGLWNHYADWVHMGVLLKLEDGHYRPNRYYFSAHAGGKAWAPNDKTLKFYTGGSPSVALGDDSVPEDELGSQIELTETSFDKLGATGPFHVGVFLAWGSHETYADTGGPLSGHAPDTASFGHYCVLPYAEELSNGPNGERIRTNAQSGYYPLYAWDLSDPQEYLPATDPKRYQNPGRYHTGPYRGFSPRQLYPMLQSEEVAVNPISDGNDGDFFAMWMEQMSKYDHGGSEDSGSGPLGEPGIIKMHEADRSWRLIAESGVKTSFGGVTPATAPPLKVFGWKSNFDE